MGEQVAATQFSRADRTRYRQKVRRCLDVFERMLRESRFDFDRPMTGLEIELNLVDDHGDPTMRNAEVLGAIADPDFQTELGQFNIEINVPPRTAGRAPRWSSSRSTLRTDLNHAEASAHEVGAKLMMIGILPTLMADHLTIDALTANPRYKLLNEQIFAARGEDIWLDIDGDERLRTSSDSIAPEAACTSVQCHLQVSPETFPAYWNAAQAIAGVQLAIGANSPFLFGKQLWRETRIALFDQATDTRSEELKEQGVRPRVWFGERWITSVFDLLEENVRYFPALLPICSDEDPVEVLEPRRRARPGRAAAAQRHRLPVEPAGLRRGRRPAAPAGGEPGAAGRPDRGRHAGQRRALLRPGPGAGRGRAAGVDADVVPAPPRRTSTPARGTASRPARSGRARRGAGHRAGAAPAAADGRRRAAPLGRRRRRCRTGCSASSSSAA